ncbi:MAG: hypothetical protein IT454_10445 [Planctomycetes bacterium]|nr:hypothetical protein [Planctomycetota bacterium]
MKQSAESRQEKRRKCHATSSAAYRREIEHLRSLGRRSDEQTGRLLQKHQLARRAVVALGDRIARALTPAEASRFAAALQGAQRELDVLDRKLGLTFDRRSEAL